MRTGVSGPFFSFTDGPGKVWGTWRCSGSAVSLLGQNTISCNVENSSRAAESYPPTRVSHFLYCHSRTSDSRVRGLRPHLLPAGTDLGVQMLLWLLDCPHMDVGARARQEEQQAFCLQGPSKNGIRRNFVLRTGGVIAPQTPWPSSHLGLSSQSCLVVKPQEGLSWAVLGPRQDFFSEFLSPYTTSTSASIA